MSHLSEGTIRRILDEPDVVSEQDTDHLEACSSCRTVHSRVQSDVEKTRVLMDAVETGAEELDPEGALSRLWDAVNNGRPADAASLVSEETKNPEPARRVPKRRRKHEKQRTGILGFVGRTFVGVGTLILLFVSYQLIGTNIISDREQNELASELESQWTSQVVEEVPDLGAGVAVMEIPKIQINDLVVVEGVSVQDLKKGPGHYPGTPLPGQVGNMVISGHRTTYGGPFNRLDELVVGDEIVVYNAAGPFKYRVTENKIVAPTAVEVLDDSTDARLTLTTCHPKYSAKERLIIVAILEGTPTAPSGNGQAPEFDLVPGES